MYLFDNPLLQRELLVNLRTAKAFVLLLAYIATLGAVVWLAWPSEQQLDLTQRPEEARRLVNMLFLGQYVLLALLAPSFAAGGICGEKERLTYEMLLATPLRPAAIVLGKLVASLGYLGLLMIASLPIVMLCLPLGGLSIYEVLATYAAIISSTAAFGMISLAAGSHFGRTASALVVSYVVILPLILAGVLFYLVFEMAAEFRLVVLGVVVPVGSLIFCTLLLARISQRLMYTPDLGSQSSDVLDVDQEQGRAVGLVIRSDQFPDYLFAPPKRDDLLPDGANPVYDKEMRSELFGQGTLMMRVVIQISMILAMPLLAICLFVYPAYAAWYVAYVLLFNLLVGPVFSAGGVASERERQTLELLLTTTLSSWQILWAKLIAGLRVSGVLTGFLVFALLLALLLPPWAFIGNLTTMGLYLAVVAMTALTTTMVALFASVVFRRTATSILASYAVLLLLFILPLAGHWIVALLFPDSPLASQVQTASLTSPFSVALALPIADRTGAENWPLIAGGFLAFYTALNGLLLGRLLWVFEVRWRAAG